MAVGWVALILISQQKNKEEINYVLTLNTSKETKPLTRVNPPSTKEINNVKVKLKPSVIPCPVKTLLNLPWCTLVVPVKANVGNRGGETRVEGEVVAASGVTFNQFSTTGAFVLANKAWKPARAFAPPGRQLPSQRVLGESRWTENMAGPLWTGVQKIPKGTRIMEATPLNMSD